MIKHLDAKVVEILHVDERILNYNWSKNTSSAYFLLIKESDKYITFRVSNHATSAFYSNRTFNIGKNINDLLYEIKCYLDTASWYIFKYEDYFSLKVLSQIPFDRIQFYIDHTMGIFDYSRTGLVFYQCRSFGRKHREFNVVSESFQKALRNSMQQD